MFKWESWRGHLNKLHIVSRLLHQAVWKRIHIRALLIKQWVDKKSRACEPKFYIHLNVNMKRLLAQTVKKHTRTLTCRTQCYILPASHFSHSSSSSQKLISVCSVVSDCAVSLQIIFDVSEQYIFSETCFCGCLPQTSRAKFTSVSPSVPCDLQRWKTNKKMIMKWLILYSVHSDLW